MNIVYVHLNTKLPRYLIENLKRNLKLFPNRQIILVHNLDYLPTIPGLIDVKLTNDEKYKDLESSLNHPSNFRDGFWISSLARLVIFQDLMLEHSGPILHVESDVILAEDFPFEYFEELPQTYAYPVVFEERAVASTVYIRNLESAEKLASFALGEAKSNPSTTDMLVLRKFFNAHPNEVFPLPFFNTVAGLDNNYTHPIDDLLMSKLQENPETNVGIFDGSDLGVYFFGTDPKNNRGKSKLREEIQFTYLKLKNWELRFRDNRDFPFAIFGEIEIPIYSFHMTCKRVKYFAFESVGRSLRKTLKDQFRHANTRLYLDVLVIQVIKSIRRRITFSQTKN